MSANLDLVRSIYAAWERGKASGIEIGQLMGVASGVHLFVIRGGKVVRFVHHWDRDLALADLRVKE